MSEKRQVLLDTNMLIGAFDTDENNPQHLQAKEEVIALLNDETIQVAITPLIRYEVLRGIKRISQDRMQAILNQFESFEISAEVANKSAEIFHKIPSSADLNDVQRKNYKHNFDIIHYTVSELYQLELLSKDSDIEKIANFVHIWRELDKL